MGSFTMTRPNPTYQLSDPTRPNPTKCNKQLSLWSKK